MYQLKRVDHGYQHSSSPLSVTTLYRIEHACDIDINADIYLSDVGIDMINTSSIL